MTLVCRWDNGTLWFSVNACVGTFGVGYLGNLYWDMGLRDSALTIVFFNLLSCAPVAYMSTFGKVRRVARFQSRILRSLYSAMELHLLRGRAARIEEKCASYCGYALTTPRRRSSVFARWSSLASRWVTGQA